MLPSACNLWPWSQFFTIQTSQPANNIFIFFVFRKMLMSAFLLRFKANYLGKMLATPIFFVGESKSPCKDVLFPHGPNLAQRTLYYSRHCPLICHLYLWIQVCKLYMLWWLTAGGCLKELCFCGCTILAVVHSATVIKFVWLVCIMTFKWYLTFWPYWNKDTVSSWFLAIPVHTHDQLWSHSPIHFMPSV